MYDKANAKKEIGFPKCGYILYGYGGREGVSVCMSLCEEFGDNFIFSLCDLW